MYDDTHRINFYDPELTLPSHLNHIDSSNVKSYMKEFSKYIIDADTDEITRTFYIESLIYCARHFQDSADIERACCHAISNVSMGMDCAKLMIKHKAHITISDILRSHILSDWKVCWLACSAIWNLARPEETRRVFQKEHVTLVILVIQHHGRFANVVNTCVGALSNLSLSDELKLQIGQRDNLKIVLNSLHTFISDFTIASTGCGLLANLAVDDNVAHRLVNLNAIRYIINAGEFHFQKMMTLCSASFRKNFIAALSNLSTCLNYKRKCVASHAVEIIYLCISHFNPIENLAELCFTALEGIGLTHTQYTTSLHLACEEGWIPEIQQILQDKTEVALLQEDCDGLYPIDMALKQNNNHVVELLVAVGSPYSTSLQQYSQTMTRAIMNGLEAKNFARHQRATTIVEATQFHLIYDSAAVVSEFCSPLELLYNS